MDVDAAIAADPDAFTGLYRIGEPRHQKPVITYQVETIKATREEAMPLLERHYEEIAQFKDVQKLDPNWEVYLALEQANKMWVMTVRDRGKLIGYFVMFINNDLHYRNLIRATEDIHFILPEYRKGIIGYSLLVRVRKAMKDLGVHTISLRTKANSDHGLLFKRLGGVLHDMVYTIVL